MAFNNSVTPNCQDSDNNLLKKAARLLATAAGRYGSDIFSSGTHAGEWAVLHAFEDSTVQIVRDGESQTITILGGDRLYGQISEVTITSGRVELYRACH